MTPPTEVGIAVPFDLDTETYLTVRRASTKEVDPGVWEFPAGKREAGESPLETAMRELREETGFIGHLLDGGMIHRRSIDGDDVIMYPFLIAVAGNTVELTEEHSDYRWFGSFDALAGLETMPNHELVFRSVRRS